ncbi:adenylyltransferase/cytidyltransferase family protein [Candidatus Pseudothioglobus singularis]|jgi:cytidyltransferase-like protein|nr:adenylyltransferase/cytidyltransferase family protein [Candidatus Pseudothioglobus singularis]
MKKRIMVDMSATLIHHGHIRILKQASKYGSVIVGLTEDSSIIDIKKYQPELAFEYRKEILSSIKYVSEVVKTPWTINEEILDKYKIDLLVHGDDNSNLIDEDRLKILPRTSGISSSEMRKDAQRAITQINNQKLMLTPGPAAVLHENIINLKPIFGRGDDEYLEMSNEVLSWIKKLSEQDKVVMAQGSATFALELAAHSFVYGKVLIVSTGYYSDRLEKLLPKDCNITLCKYEEIHSLNEQFDWVLCAYTETSIAFKVDLEKIKAIADSCKAKLYVDATGSIGLENNHGLADLMAFSSCKGLFGLTGACFVAYKSHLVRRKSQHFYFNLDTHINKMVTGPYHAIASLYGVMESHDVFRERVIKSKKLVIEKWHKIVRPDNQPLLCSYLEGKVIPHDNNIVMYSPRSELNGSVICHFGEIHYDQVNIDKRISVDPC